MIDLAINHQQTVGLRQEQTLTQQQIQAVEMLAAPLMELEAFVNGELQDNPLLEAEPADQEVPADKDEAPGVQENDDEWIRQLVELSEPGFRSFGAVYTASADDEERRNHFMSSIPARVTLEDSLLEQIRFLDITPAQVACCETIIAGLDEGGYLTTHPADLAMALGMSLEEVAATIRIVQSCEPVGVAAADLRERLLLQLERRGQQDGLAYQLVGEHLDDLGANRIPTLARRLGVDIERIREALHVIQELRPHIAETGPESHSLEIEPEVDIEERGDSFDIQVRSPGVPSLRISAQYRNLLSDPATTTETSEYIKDKIRSAAFLINCIGQRQSTLERISRAIVQAQEDFFRQGLEHMRPLTMAEVAEQIGVHETTVSRGVSGKYLRCKYGTMPLRRFFSNGYQDSRGKRVSSHVVQSSVRRLINDENRRKPLSDSQISAILGQHGLQVARRTVAKYRENMGLLPAKLRRQYW